MKFILYIFNLLLYLSAWALLGHIQQNKTDKPRKRIFSFWLCLVALHHTARRNDTSNAARPCFSRYVAIHTIAAPQTLVPKCLEHLSDEFFFKFFVNFRPRVFVFAR